ncbi:MucB/RseB C-terminal domain-containing protein [Caenimonas aquaedulcis]|uniref:MucB/RseB C-terminal domain-containing protein n=1 Tax=Caenimonas aquaedulcis TaxID=2793270 RepID=A0A931H3I4_9BURK|nr:MucB/RseB C-terminal domain-containing protein [Caenimonas aquaedulcis]MBG9387884.1 MucB/RseB C-terminal domain-containing protein [Caenimonas aquaedulcis]
MHLPIPSAFRIPGRLIAAWCCLAPLGPAAAETPQPAAPVTTAQARVPERSVSEWLLRMHEASKLRSYIGTFVVLSSNGGMSSARIWHACEGNQQIERVESLTGAPRSTFRRNEEVVTFLPETRVVRTEKRESLGFFPSLLKSADSSIPEFYGARRLGHDRVAGFETDVVQLAPKDSLRYGYRIWSEKKSGLVVKLQTIDVDGTVLEQAAFSELALDAPVRMDKLNQMMGATNGWRVERSEAVKTTPEAQGWQMRVPVAGFRPISCYKPPFAGTQAPDGALQWIFSDGLAAVSLFVEQYDKQRHVQEGQYASGATQTLTRRIQDWWLTAVGEVPPQTLKAFALGLERRK